ncbi:MAG: glycosyltransferase family 8 protein [Bacteroidales bacterium]|jgi:lipopolysaccharide biosynthesis glycosyltransferase|nr:glycosyltransferase family 8 protein [Bacteroidales bacterium]
MNKIPITFSFDDNFVIAAGVCLSSLLENAKQDTFYDIFILYSEINLSKKNRMSIMTIKEKYPNCNITYINVGKAFENSYEIRNTTIAAYYRLLLPELISIYDKVIYSDVDIIFQDDLHNIYKSSLHSNQLIGGVCDGAVFSEDKWTKHHFNKLNCNPKKYINSGFLILNLKLMRDEHIVNIFKKHQNKKYYWQDQDIINIVCKGRIEIFPFKYNYTQIIYLYAHTNSKFSSNHQNEIFDAEQKGVIHYTIGKPWNSYCLRGDIWWEYYRKSIFYDKDYYYKTCSSITNKNIDIMPLKMLPKFILYRIRKKLFLIKSRFQG